MIHASTACVRTSLDGRADFQTSDQLSDKAGAFRQRGIKSLPGRRAKLFIELHQFAKRIQKRGRCGKSDT